MHLHECIYHGLYTYISFYLGVILEQAFSVQLNQTLHPWPLHQVQLEGMKMQCDVYAHTYVYYAHKHKHKHTLIQWNPNIAGTLQNKKTCPN